MSKTIPSPVPAFPGTITLPDNLDYDQCVIYEEARANLIKLAADQVAAHPQPNPDGLISYAQATRHIPVMAPALNACIESRDIKGWGEKFPATPKAASIALLKWVNNELMKLYDEEAAIPNALESGSSDTPPTPTETQDQPS